MFTPIESTFQECQISYDKETDIYLVGPNPFDDSSSGKQPNRIITYFPNTNTLVSHPRVSHTAQVKCYLRYLDHILAASKDNTAGEILPKNVSELAEMTSTERYGIIDEDAVKMTVIYDMYDGRVIRYLGIRPHVVLPPDEITNDNLMFLADEAMRHYIPVFRIFFMSTENDQVRKALRRRGEIWRIQPVPQSRTGMQMVYQQSQWTLNENSRSVYHYNMTTGSRFLTYSNFCVLGKLSDKMLAAELTEIKNYSARCNKSGHAEVAFFQVKPEFSAESFKKYDFMNMSSEELRKTFAELCKQFRQALTDVLFEKDDSENSKWLSALVATVTNPPKFTTEEVRLGLCEEMRTKITWMPGATIKPDGIRLSLFHHQKDIMTPQEVDMLLDDVPLKLIKAILRENIDVEYINIGRMKRIRYIEPQVPEQLDGEHLFHKRRQVYVIHLKRFGDQEANTYITRLQKWGVIEQLDEKLPNGEFKSSLERSIHLSDEYTDFTLNRRMAAQFLKMNLPRHIWVRHIAETYRGRQEKYRGKAIRTPYYEREYIPGYTTVEIPLHYYQQREFALALAKLMGQTAASCLIAGKTHSSDISARFDKGDEIVLLDQNDLPCEIIVSEMTGSFVQYEEKLVKLISYYGDVVNSRIEYLGASAIEFAHIYVTFFAEQYLEIQRTAPNYSNIFDDHSNKAPESAYDRWQKVLKRLRETPISDLLPVLVNSIHLNINFDVSKYENQR